MEKVKRNTKTYDGEKFSRSLLAEIDALKVIDEEVPNSVTKAWKKTERSVKSLIIELQSVSFLGFASNESTAKQIFQTGCYVQA